MHSPWSTTLSTMGLILSAMACGSDADGGAAPDPTSAEPEAPTSASDEPGAGTPAAPGAAAGGAEADGATGGSDATDAPPACPGSEVTAIAPLAVSGAGTAQSGLQLVAFVDPSTGCATQRVHDADREVVFFDAAGGAMIWADSGDAVGGWTVDGAALDWTRSGVPFQVRFGSEDGERRAYFTEAGPGTICNLDIAGPDLLFISATRERPPN